MLGRAMLGFGCALLVTGCAAGQITQTDTQELAINGTSAQLGEIAIRNAEFSYPTAEEAAVFRPGSDADVTMSIINEGRMSDELISARSDAASDVVIEGEREIAAGHVLMLDSERPLPDDVAKGELTLQGLTKTLRSGENIELTLTFQDAGEVTFEVPMRTPDELRGGPQ